MAVLFCDTNCELMFDKAKELGLTNIIRMPYTICGEEYYYDLGENYDPKKFFDLVRAGNMPITSGLNAENYKDYFRPFFEKNEEILYVSFSSQLSGTFAYMDTAVKELQAEFPEAKFTRFDTKGISMCAGLAVYAAAKLFNEGKSVAEITEFLDEFIYRCNAIFTPDDLQHLKRGGRLSSVQAFFGTLLQVKPIIRVTAEGKLAATQKVNGRLKALHFVADDTIAHYDRESGYPIVILEADCAADADKVIERIKAAHPNAEIWRQSVGPVIGTHCGPGTLGICYVGDHRAR